ncbi:MAG: DUF6036 family nucleotidyltransferase [Steroidobacteraceae bacterium]
MKLASFTVIVSALERAGVRYIVAGGLAVNAHGYLRFTKDVDIVVQLVRENIVLQFWSDKHPETPINMFVTEPFPFDEEYSRALVKPLHGSIDVRFVSLPTLVRMKETAGRSQDLVDIENLKLRADDHAPK